MFLQTYRSGHNEPHSKCGHRLAGAWVRIPPSASVGAEPAAWVRSLRSATVRANLTSTGRHAPHRLRPKRATREKGCSFVNGDKLNVPLPPYAISDSVRTTGPPVSSTIHLFLAVRSASSLLIALYSGLSVFVPFGRTTATLKPSFISV